MISAEKAAALASEIIANEGAVYVDSTSDSFQFAISLIKGLISTAPAVGPEVAKLVDLAADASFAIPGPTGPIVVIGKTDGKEPLSMVEAAAAQSVGAAAIVSKGAIQSMVNKLGSSELRAVQAAHEEGARIFVRYLLTGHLPVLDDCVAEATKNSFGVVSEMTPMVRGMLASTLFSISLGAPPPLRCAEAALRWLQTNSPEDIVPPGWKAEAQ